ncbi:MAG: ABC transporter permease [Lachnospiraceae bacterium]|jgi:spermidine/putrescine transport system permease protein|nr:ABC transporter permease [Lachnospiraceae bacterium]MCR4697516.1 ABC transporter permease [Lachnospiraceae bacterium]
MSNVLKKIYIALIFIFLYAPMAVLIVLSFNASKSRSKWGGFTFKWYAKLLSDSDIMEALGTTLLLAVLSSLIATFIGTIAAIAIMSFKKGMRTMLLGITNIPMLNAEIVTGISLMLLFIFFNIKFGFTTILLAHITFNIPYVILSVMPRIKQLNPSAYEAAMDLGASPFKAFMKVVFPDILPGVFSGLLMAFTMSIDDFIITHFTKGAGVDTLSTKIYSQVRKGIDPKMYALSSVIFITVLILLILVNMLPGSKSKAKKAK